MLDDSDFHRAIQADPKADGPRLVYSDWLEEDGDPARAEAIRLGVALRRAGMSRSEANGSTREPQSRLSTILRENAGRWAESLPKVEMVGWGDCRDGLFEELGIFDADAFRANSRALLDAQPVHVFTYYCGRPIRAGLEAIVGAPGMDRLGGLGLLCRHVMPDSARVVAAADHLSRLRSLHLEGDYLSDTGARTIARAGHLKTLAELNLEQNRITAEGARAIARSGHLRGLTTLNLTNNPLGDAGAEAVASGRFEGLRALSLPSCGIGPAGGEALAASGCLGGLTRLDLGENGLQAGGVVALAGAIGMSKLAWLDLSTTRPGPDGARALARAGHWPDLRALHLIHAGLDHRDVAAIAGAPWMGHLARLSLDYNFSVGTAGIKVIAARPNRLEALSLSETYFEEAGAEILARSEHFSHLVELVVHGNSIGDRGVRALAGSGNFPALRGLDLMSNKIGDDGVIALAGSPHLSGLRALGLGSNQIGDAGALALARSPHLAGLETLDLSYNAIGPKGARALAESESLANLRDLNLSDNKLDKSDEDRLRGQFGGRVRF
jgi:uncharacterized protein (TIGR02996 family)